MVVLGGEDRRLAIFEGKPVQDHGAPVGLGMGNTSEIQNIISSTDGTRVQARS